MNTNISNSTTALSTLIERALPAKGEIVKFNHNSQMYETERYVSASGNAYFRGIKLSDRLAIEFCFGDGYFYRFINSIRLYCFNGTTLQAIAVRNYYAQPSSSTFCRNESIDMLKGYLKSQAELIGGVVDNATITSFATQLIETTSQRIAA